MRLEKHISELRIKGSDKLERKVRTSKLGDALRIPTNGKLLGPVRDWPEGDILRKFWIEDRDHSNVFNSNWEASSRAKAADIVFGDATKAERDMALVLGRPTARAEDESVLEIALDVADAAKVDPAASRAQIMVGLRETAPVHALAVLPMTALLAVHHKAVGLGDPAETLNNVGPRPGHRRR
jgi:hypothetical protein